jgi:predicted secreted Zn-dependent protease
MTIAFGCRTLLPEPGVMPDEPVPTPMPGEVFPTDPSEPATTSQPDNLAITVTREKKFYRITGSTEKDLRQQLNVLGPPDEESGKIFDARTDWVINWYFYYNQGNNECTIDRVDVSLSITYTYPEWKPPSDASKALVTKWINYMQKLSMHEEGHGSLADNGVQIIYKTILDMPPSTTCDALGDATNAAALEKIDDLKQRQRAYDDETGHGETQGAIFP